jgi:hypothetical protein
MAMPLNSDCSGAEFQPRTVPALLRLLGVSDRPVTEQWLAISEWLAENTPSAELRCSLRANGYGPILIGRGPSKRTVASALRADRPQSNPKAGDGS